MFKPPPYDLFNQPEGQQGQGVTGLSLAKAGAELAADNAEQYNAGWKNRAWELLNEYLLEQHQPFQAEDFRKWAYARGLEKPKNERAIGSIFMQARRQQLIIKQGVAPVDNLKAHQAYAAVWVVGRR